MTYKFSDIAINSVEKRLPTESDKSLYIGLEHLVSGSLSVPSCGSPVPLKGEKLVMKKGDVLFGKRNTYLRRASIAPHDGLFSAHGMILRPKTDVVDASYFPFFVNSDVFFDATIKISVGSLSPTVNWKDMKELEFDLPPLDRQKELAELLWAANDLKESYKKMIVATDEMLKAKFREMFGACDVREKSDCPWELQSFASFAKIDAEMTTDYKKYADYPHIGIDSIESGSGELKGYRTVKQDNVISGKYVFTPAHIIYSKIRPNLNKVALPDFEGLCSADSYPILPLEGCNRVFLAHVLRSYIFLDYILPHSARTGMPKVNRDQLLGFSMRVPPLALQQQFVEIARKADETKAALKKSIVDVEQVIKGLING